MAQAQTFAQLIAAAKALNIATKGLSRKDLLRAVAAKSAPASASGLDSRRVHAVRCAIAMATRYQTGAKLSKADFTEFCAPGLLKAGKRNAKTGTRRAAFTQAELDSCVPTLLKAQA